MLTETEYNALLDAYEYRAGCLSETIGDAFAEQVNKAEYVKYLTLEQAQQAFAGLLALALCTELANSLQGALSPFDITKI